MRLLIPICLLFVLTSNNSFEENKPPKWVQLFNGKDLKEWKPKITGYALDDNYANTFNVENGVMKVKYDGYSLSKGSLDISFIKINFHITCLLLNIDLSGNNVKMDRGGHFVIVELCYIARHRKLC
jgi:hypothetical protein